MSEKKLLQASFMFYRFYFVFPKPEKFLKKQNRDEKLFNFPIIICPDETNSNVRQQHKSVKPQLFVLIIVCCKETAGAGRRQVLVFVSEG